MDRQLRVAGVLGAAGLAVGLVMLAPWRSQGPTYGSRVKLATTTEEPQQSTVVVPTAVGGGPPATAENTATEPVSEPAPESSGRPVPVVIPAPTIYVTTPAPSVYVAPPSTAPSSASVPTASEAIAPTTSTSASASAPASAPAPPPPDWVGIPSSGGVVVDDAGVMYDPNVPMVLPVPIFPVAPAPKGSPQR